MKTINCAECNVEVTYEENPRFPRKYCLKHSAEKKASFKESQVPKGEPRPDLDEDEMVPEAEKMGVPNGGTKKDNGFALTIGNVRSNALASAIEWASKTHKDRDLMQLAKTFEQYILTGE